MQKTSIVLIALTCGLILTSNAQTKQTSKNNQTIQQTDKKMENNFSVEQKKVFSTIERMVAAFEKKILRVYWQLMKQMQL
jgi:hypothetical protein